MRVIDDAFLEKWQPDREKFALHQTKYARLLDRVQKDIGTRQTLSKPVFIEVVDWKSPRIRPIFQRRPYGEYRDGIKACLKADDADKLPGLDELYGIGAPVASTLLHFIYPGEFPIIDFRTAQALHYRGYIATKTVDGKSYAAFRRAILEIREKNDRWSLREIDLALFAYHKAELWPVAKQVRK